MSKKTKTTPHATMAALQAPFQQAASLHQAGYLAQAEALYKEILALNPRHVDALHLLGVLAAQTQRADIGVQLIEQAIAINPHQAALYSNLGNALMALGRYDDAARAYGKAVTLKPDFAEAHCNRGNAFKAVQRYSEAVASYGKALALNPALADAHGNLGNALSAMHRHADALAHLDKALSLRPAYPEALNSRGVVLSSLSRYAEALAAFDQALGLQPDSAEAHANRGNVLREMGQFAQARQSYERALQLRPAYPEALSNLAVTLQESGDAEAAIEHYQQALALNPDYLQAHSNMLFAMSFAPRCTPQDYLAQARAYGQKVQALARPFDSWSVAPLSDGQPLRVGLVSGDLRHHPVGLFLEGILALLPRSQIELVAYPTLADDDALTARIQPFFSAWTPLTAMTDEAAARQIHADGIHLLIDLAGHTAGNRLPLFAWKPAPVQLSWLGFLASTGVPGMDYLLADPISVPASAEGDFTEQIWRLPDTINCFTTPAEGPEQGVQDTPASHSGHITFGSYQNPAKVSDAVLSTWSRVLAAVPSARLRLQSRALDHEVERQALTQRLSQAGIDPTRVSLVGAIASREAHLASHREVDIILDTFPYPGITTTCEALWMGVPTLTLAGRTMLSRQGATLLHVVGLDDWVADSEQSYVDLAARHASDVPRLSALRRELRERARLSPLFDAPLFAQRLTQALREMALTSPAVRKSP
jgi:protein O-GlcNAc transferase